MVMKKVNIADAKAGLSALLDRVEKGEIVTIMRRNEPIAELRPVRRQRKEPRPWGQARGEFVVPEDFNDPLSDDLLDAFEGRDGERTP